MKTIFSEQEWDVIVTFLSGEATVEETNMLKEILLSPVKKEYFEELKQTWELSSNAAKYEHFNSAKAFGKIPLNKVPKIDHTIALRTLLKIAAIFVIVIGALFSWVLLRNGNFSNSTNTIIVRNGEQSQVILSDGTNVWLNSGSKLTYPSSFNGKTREVTLEGEAYFDVTHNNKLFVVSTKNVRIKVLGTAFNIKSYPDDYKVEATLVRGSVTIEKTGEGKEESPIVLKPGEKVTYLFNNIRKSSPDKTANENMQTESKPAVIAKVDPLPITLWKEKALIFDNSSMGEMAVTLERWFGIKVFLDSDTLKHFQYKGKFEHNENIFQVLEVIKITTPITYDYKDHEVTIKLLTKH
jgi:ferric-dicitrate binding protein FerR (iron transport regulator)